ncbi:MAG: acyltransferase family protein [Candidatus Paceibacterota bacterium]
MDIQEKRIVYIDVLRFLAIFFIIVIHVVSGYAWNGYGDNYYWFAANVFWAISAIGVPIFVMISGSLLLSGEKEEPDKMFFQKRILRLFVPFFVWSLVYLAYQNRFDINAILGIFRAPVYFHLWFVYMIIGIYFMLPLIKIVFNSRLKESFFKYFLLVWFILASVVPFIFKIVQFKTPDIWYLRDNIVLLLGYFVFLFLGYFVLGYLLGNTNLKPKTKKCIYCFSAVSFILTLVGTYLLLLKNGKFDPYFYGELAPNIVMMSVGFFVFIKDVDWQKILNERIMGFLKGFSSIAYGIYLSHALFLALILRALVLYPNPLVQWLLVSVVCLAASYLFCALVSRVKILKKLLVSFS